MGSLPNRLNAQGKPLPPCTGRFRQQWGLPCAHELRDIIKRRADGDKTAKLTKSDFDKYWWLERRLDEEYPHLRLQDPDLVKGKGRPRGSGPFATSTPSATSPDLPPPSTAPAALQSTTAGRGGRGRGQTRGGAKASTRREPSSWEREDLTEAEASRQPKRARGRPRGSSRGGSRGDSRGGARGGRGARRGAQGGRGARGGARDGQVTNTTGIVNAMESAGPRDRHCQRHGIGRPTCRRHWE
jgi:hypothetical protein